MTQAAISVVIVNYNAGALLTASVRAVLSSSVPVEVFVVDNASMDGSLSMLRATVGDDPRLRVLENPANVGFAAANNRVLGAVDTPYVLLLNPDCEVGAHTLERVWQAMERAPEAGIAGCLVRDPDGGEQAACRRSIPTPWRSLTRVLGLNRLFPRDPRFRSFDQSNQPLPTEPAYLEGISGAFMFVRRAAMDEVGLLDEGYFLHCEDLDWFMRFRHAGWRVLFVPGAEAVHAKGACSSGSPIRVLWYKHRGMTRFYSKFFRNVYPFPMLWLVNATVWLRFAALAILGTGSRFAKRLYATGAGRP